MASASKSAGRATLILGFLFCAVLAGDDPTPTDTKGAVQLKDVVVVLLSQHHPYHAHRAQVFTQHFSQQLAHLPQEERPQLILPHEQWLHLPGWWTLFPLMAKLVQLYEDKRWVVVCEEETRMDLSQLPLFLQKYDEVKTPFVGRALRDKEPVIIHHFAFADDPSSFAYPDFGAGVVLSLPLIRRVAEKLEQGNDDRMNFAIDPKHEFARYLLDHLGERLTSACELCGSKESTPACPCVTWQPVAFPLDCGEAVGKEDLFVAVKTCSKFHKDRVPVVKATWGQETELIAYYSEEEDPSIPTIDLGLANTERGHCGKTAAIIRHVASNKKLANVSWLLIADDDTIISLDLLRRLLPCYVSEKPLFLGERYGYLVSVGSGYNYITGGGGMVFNRAAVELLAKYFQCGRDDDPDDMMLGLFFTQRALPLTHSPYFHQARPEDYSEEWLSVQVPVSFHKHWNTDPYKVYHRLTSAPLTHPHPQPHTHQEL